MVMENTTPATVIIEPATAVSKPREPAAPAPKSSGHFLSKVHIDLRLQGNQTSGKPYGAQNDHHGNEPEARPRLLPPVPQFRNHSQ